MCWFVLFVLRSAPTGPKKAATPAAAKAGKAPATPVKKTVVPEPPRTDALTSEYELVPAAATVQCCVAAARAVLMCVAVLL